MILRFLLFKHLKTEEGEKEEIKPFDYNNRVDTNLNPNIVLKTQDQ